MLDRGVCTDGIWSVASPHILKCVPNKPKSSPSHRTRNREWDLPSILLGSLRFFYYSDSFFHRLVCECQSIWPGCLFDTARILWSPAPFKYLVILSIQNHFSNYFLSFWLYSSPKAVTEYFSLRFSIITFSTISPQSFFFYLPISMISFSTYSMPSL